MKTSLTKLNQKVASANSLEVGVRLLKPIFLRVFLGSTSNPSASFLVVSFSRGNDDD